MAEPPLIALTGATGFVGKVLLQDLLRQGLRVRALARSQPQRALPDAPGLEWVNGDLSSQAALQSLVTGARTVIHLAGVTKAKAPGDFMNINAAQSGNLVEIARSRDVFHFIHISSLAARRPDASAYANSKAQSEALAGEKACGMALTIVRAPAVLGPGDEATRPLFSALARGILPVPGGRASGFHFSMIDVRDLSRFLQSLAVEGQTGMATVEPAGHLALGWDDIAQSAQRVLGRPVRRITIAPLLMKVAGQTADFMGKLSSKPQVFSSGKVDELLSGDWVASTQVPQAVSLDRTLERCLAPFLPSDRKTRGNTEANGEI